MSPAMSADIGDIRGRHLMVPKMSPAMSADIGDIRVATHPRVALADVASRLGDVARPFGDVARASNVASDVGRHWRHTGAIPPG